MVHLESTCEWGLLAFNVSAVIRTGPAEAPFQGIRGPLKMFWSIPLPRMVPSLPRNQNTIEKYTTIVPNKTFRSHFSKFPMNTQNTYHELDRNATAYKQIKIAKKLMIERFGKRQSGQTNRYSKKMCRLFLSFFFTEQN